MKYWLSLGFVPETEQLIDLARFAEELGFEGVTLADHLVMPAHVATKYPYTPDGKTFWPDDTAWPDPFVTLAAMGAATSRLKLATNIYLMAARDVFTAARAVSTAAVLTHDRVVCGVSAGWLKEEYDIVGVDFRTRDARLDEMIAACRLLFSGETVRFDGRHIRFDDVRMLPAPKKAVPFFGGGASPTALRRVATLCDGWLGLAFKPEQLYPMLDRLNALRAEAGRSDLPFDVLVGLTVRQTPELTRELESRGVTGLVSTPFFGARDASSLDAKKAILEKFAKHIIQGIG